MFTISKTQIRNGYKAYFIVLALLLPLISLGKGINGKVLSAVDNLPIPFVSISTKHKSVISDDVGRFTLPVTSRDKVVYFSRFGYQTDSLMISPTDTFLLIKMLASSVNVDTVNIVGFRKENKKVSSSIVGIPIAQIDKIQMLGESDPLKIAQLTPGILSGGEAIAGLFVRGSSSDKNLFLLDEMVLYNPFHQFGLYSIINSDAIADFNIHKGDFPAEYGGKLASVVDVKTKEGRKDKFGGIMKIGLLMSKIMIESPITKKTSFYFSGRGTYGHHLTKPFVPVPTSVYFYDANWKITSQLSKKTNINIGGVYTFDKLKLESFDENDLGFGLDLTWENIGNYIRVDHRISNKLILVTSLSSSNYSLTNYLNEKHNFREYSTEAEDINDFETVKISNHLNLESKITDVKLNSKLTYFLNKKHKMKFGVEGIYHKIRPGIQQSQGEEFIYSESTIFNEEPVELSAFVTEEWTVKKWWVANIGLRFSSFKNKTTATNFEPRINSEFILNKNNSINLGFTKMNQYLYVLKSNGIGLPTDLWISYSKDTPAQQSVQSSVGYKGRIKKIKSNVTISAYYKTSTGLVAYNQGTSFASTNDLTDFSEDNLDWRSNVTVGEGETYGTEFLVHKTKGKFNGWVSYTLSWSKVKFEGLNRGDWYFDGIDRRHVFNLVLFYQFTKKLSLNSVFTYMTGNPITVAISNIGTRYSTLQEYEGLNNIRNPAYHRLDLGLRYKWLIKNRKAHLDFNIYNTYSRKNVYMYYIVERQPKKISLLPIVPSISFTYAF